MAYLSKGEVNFTFPMKKKTKEEFKKVAKRVFGSVKNGSHVAVSDFVEKYGQEKNPRPEVSE